MSARIEQKFAALARANRKGLITFIMGGDPGLKASGELLAKLPEAGADIIEIGMPFSDPMADGPAIQAAGLRALKAGAKLKDILAMVGNFRMQDSATPIILMGYYNPVYSYGTARFCKDAIAAGVDGVILVDLPPEEEEEFTRHSGGLHLIRLVTPTTDDARLALLNKHAGGFLYYVSIAGVTGTKSADATALSVRVKHIKAQSALPVAVGFGIKTPEQAAQIAPFCDAVVVGSALVEKTHMPEEALAFVRSLRTTMER